MPMIYSESQFIQNASDELKTVRFPELCMRSAQMYSVASRM